MIDVTSVGCLEHTTIEEMQAILEIIMQKRPVKWGHFILVSQAIGQLEARKPEFYKILWP